MAARPTKNVSRPKGKGKGRRQYRKRGKRSGNVADYAGVSEKRTLTAPGGGNFNINTLYNLMNTQLVDYPRAAAVAKAYQHYRIKRIAVTFKPTYDTFSAGFSKMHLYYMIDKSGSIPSNTTLEGLKQMGARPKTLDEKEMVISWAPSVLESSMYQVGAPAAGSPAKYIIHPWLSTNANIASPGVPVTSGIDHLGLYWFCEQLVTPGTTGYEIEVEVQFQFKKPLTQSLTSSTQAIPAQVAVLNDSPDGIVGGVDGV